MNFARQRSAEVLTEVSGTFEVDLSPLDAYTNGVDGMHLNRMAIEKRYHGELNAVARGELLSAVTSCVSDCGYVALEQIKGTLGGKEGSFVVQQFGVMEKSRSHLVMKIVPNSGTGELVGIQGSMEIDNPDETSDSEHHYRLNYRLD